MATKRRACLLDLWQDEIHRFHLTDAKRAPAAADEAEHEASFGEQVGGGDALAVVILKLEFGNLRADGQNIRGQTLFLLQFRDGARMNRLRLRRNILRDQFLALGKDLAQRTNVSLRSRFFEGAPFHKSSGQ